MTGSTGWNCTAATAPRTVHNSLWICFRVRQIRNPTRLTPVGNSLYFLAGKSAQEQRLFRVLPGEKPVALTQADSEVQFEQMAAVDDRLFFVTRSSGDRRLWSIQATQSTPISLREFDDCELPELVAVGAKTVLCGA